VIEQRDKKVLIDIFFHRNKTAHLNKIIETIPLVQQLDISFWEDRSFLRWQLMRLNKVYQEDVCKVWKKYLRYEDLKRRSAIVDFFSSFGEHPPHPQASFMDWVEAQNEPGESYDEQGISGDIPDLETYLRARREYLKKEEKVLRDSFELEEKDDSWELMLMDPLPIPWIFRFPWPNYIARLPISRGKGTTFRGRPPKWAENLLIYELSQAGMKNKQIAELVLGAEKFCRMDKDPIYVRINTILKTVEKAVSKAYPFPEPT
jgi:hypothetical protein